MIFFVQNSSIFVSYIFVSAKRDKNSLLWTFLKLLNICQIFQNVRLAVNTYIYKTKYSTIWSIKKIERHTRLFGVIVCMGLCIRRTKNLYVWWVTCHELTLWINDTSIWGITFYCSKHVKKIFIRRFRRDIFTTTFLMDVFSFST